MTLLVFPLSFPSFPFLSSSFLSSIFFFLSVFLFFLFLSDSDFLSSLPTHTFHFGLFFFFPPFHPFSSFYPPHAVPFFFFFLFPFYVHIWCGVTHPPTCFSHFFFFFFFCFCFVSLNCWGVSHLPCSQPARLPSCSLAACHMAGQVPYHLVSHGHSYPDSVIFFRKTLNSDSLES